MHLRNADCRGGRYGTDQSATAHDPHEFFPDKWGEAVRCQGWTQAEANATAALKQIRAYAAEHRAPDEARLEAHPGVLASISQLLVPDRPGEDAAILGHQLEVYLGVPLTPAPLEPGQWRLIVPDALLDYGERGIR